MNNKEKLNNENDTLEDVEKSVGILEKLANIFISLFSIFSGKKTANKNTERK